MSSPKDSAVLIVWRPDPSSTGGREVLWLRRGPKLAFGAGFHAFPGGKLDPSDAGVPVRGATGLDAALRACAVRECFEETGLLVARGAEKLSSIQRHEMRRKLASGSPFAGLLAENGLSLEADDLVDAGRWITPPFYPSRFDARFFLARAPEQEVEFSEEEVSEGGFVSPRAALNRWRQGTALLHPPNWNAMVALAGTAGTEVGATGAALERLRHPPLTRDFVTSRIEFQEGIVLVPQRTPTLPPATHTNAYLLGTDEVAIVDPGAEEDAELDVLLEVVEALRSEGRQPRAIALTHHHHDHVGGVAKLRERLGDLPVWAHALAVEPLGRAGIPVARTLADLEPLGLRGFPVTALHTPGHTRGHVTFWHEPSGAAVIGDLVSGVSTIVIDPPEGNMADYLRSLERLLTIKPRGGTPARRPELPGGPELPGVATLYPAHGPVMADAPAKLREYLDHRRDRERQVMEALRGGAGTPAEIVPRIYQGTPEFLFPFAERSVQAHLDKLAAEGKTEVRDGRYHSRPASPVVSTP